MPVRIQLKRTKGWRKPAGAVVVARPTFWGNPYTVAGYLDVWDRKATVEEARRGCVGMYRDWLRGHLVPHPDLDARRKAVFARLPELRGKDLCCWCPLGHQCHADVLLELANREEGT